MQGTREALFAVLGKANGQNSKSEPWSISTLLLCERDSLISLHMEMMLTCINQPLDLSRAKKGDSKGAVANFSHQFVLDCESGCDLEGINRNEREEI